MWQRWLVPHSSRRIDVALMVAENHRCHTDGSRSGGQSSASFVIAPADTVMPQPSAELMQRVFPDVPLRGRIAGNASLLSFGRAKQVLGFTPQHS
jgi:hypothetical protein